MESNRFKTVWPKDVPRPKAAEFEELGVNTFVFMGVIRKSDPRVGEITMLWKARAKPLADEAEYIARGTCSYCGRS